MDALPQHPLAIARDLYGLSQSGLAEEIKQAARRRDRRAGTTKQQVSVWERPGGRVPDAWFQKLIADVFRVGHDRVTVLGWPYWLPGNEAPAALGTGATVAALREAQRCAMLNRRTLVGLAPAALAALAQQWATLDPALAASATDGQAVAPEFVTWLETSVKHLTGMATVDRQHSAQLLDSYYDTVVGLLEKSRYDQATEARLYTLASSLAQTIGGTASTTTTTPPPATTGAPPSTPPTKSATATAEQVSSLIWRTRTSGSARPAPPSTSWTTLSPAPRTPPPAPCSTCARPGPWP
ncbi:helix-turn-helix domain-containing protein [Streptomyces sp. NRRL S-1813]|uniref:helix-turn-helix domain-containing protein n=1 Tax=Streptomyces sp. NRRL S-1813 TaxID=1463888 RepID=UPI00068EFD5A|nr:helix-turn-helix transcriptional regulator [Streptomyces sp. NRRL S-1813]